MRVRNLNARLIGIFHGCDAMKRLVRTRVSDELLSDS